MYIYVYMMITFILQVATTRINSYHSTTVCYLSYMKSLNMTSADVVEIVEATVVYF